MNLINNIHIFLYYFLHKDDILQFIEELSIIKNLNKYNIIQIINNSNIIKIEGIWSFIFFISSICKNIYIIFLHIFY